MAGLKVLNVLTRLSPSGGIPIVVRQIIEGASESFEHHVCQIRPIAEIDLRAFPLPGDRYRSLELEGAWTRSWRSIPAALRLRRIISEIGPDVVHIHTGSSLIAAPAKLLLRNSIGWVVDLHEPIRARHSAVTSALVSLLTRGRARAVTHTETVFEEILTTMAIPRDRLSLIRLGIDVERFAKQAPIQTSWRRNHEFEEDDILVITVGRVSEMKGLDNLIEIAKEIRNEDTARRVVFVLVGSGSDRDRLTRLIKESNLTHTVKPLGHVDDLREPLQAADIYLTASRYEGFGLSVVEAMASRLPVIASDVGGLKVVVADKETGYLIPPDDVRGFVEALLSLIRDPELRMSMGDAGLTRARSEFDVSRMIEEYETVYRDVAKEASLQSP
jgi:L-malate glycosyltransferase